MRLWMASLSVLCAVGAANAMTSGQQEALAELERALSLEPNIENGKRVFQVCAVCHLPEGWGTSDGAYPQVAGQLPSVLIKQLTDIRAMNRDNPTMRPFTTPALLGGAQEIADVTAYIAQLPMNPRNGVGPGNDLEHGKKVYQEHCVDCHGESGEGNRPDHIPLIQGQHFNYLVRQFDWIRSGKRRNSDEKMVKQIRAFSQRDEMAVLDYVSRLRPPAEKVATDEGWQNPDFPKYHRGPTSYRHQPPPRPQRSEPPQRPDFTRHPMAPPPPPMR